PRREPAEDTPQEAHEPPHGWHRKLLGGALLRLGLPRGVPRLLRRVSRVPAPPAGAPDGAARSVPEVRRHAQDWRHGRWPLSRRRRHRVWSVAVRVCLSPEIPRVLLRATTAVRRRPWHASCCITDHHRCTVSTRDSGERAMRYRGLWLFLLVTFCVAGAC